MPTAPDVSIIIPTFNDEAWVGAALESCLAQTASSIEVVCVDDASTDDTREVIERFRARDTRIRLIQLETNATAFQARRVGVEAATAPYVMFLDGDDELVPATVKTVLKRARKDRADVIGFGVQVIMPDGSTRSSLENQLQPTHAKLVGEDILPALFPPGRSANGHIWRYLFKRELLRDTYADLPTDIAVPRANDLPVSFLAIAAAKSYVSTPERLYRYYFRRGTSGHQVADLERFEFYLGAVGSVELIENNLGKATREWDNPESAWECYESARLSIIGNLLRYCTGASDQALQDACVERLEDRVGKLETIRAAANFYPDALKLLARANREAVERRPQTRRVLLTTAELTTGGVQSVVVSQARFLTEAGFNVTIAVHRPGEPAHDIPAGVSVVGVEGEDTAARIASWVAICQKSGADVIIDHHVLYNRMWPYFVLAARALGIPTIGWLHNFALRPLFDNSDNNSFLVQNLPTLDTVVTLSPTDVAYWKLRGISRVVWLPNPPSPTLLRELGMHATPKAPPTETVKLVWWGRLQESTKRVRSLIAVAAALRERGVNAQLTIIGPDTPDMTAAQLQEDADASGVGDAVHLLGPLHGRDLIDQLLAADLFVSTSAIEGAPLTLVEAQALGLPVAMFELPWLAHLEGNDGVVAVAQGDVRALAREIALLTGDPERYTSFSVASLAAANRATRFPFADLYRSLLDGALPAQYSPDPTLTDAELLLEWSTLYAETIARYSRRQRRRLAALRQQLSDKSLRRLARRAAARARRGLRPRERD